MMGAHIDRTYSGVQQQHEKPYVVLDSLFPKNLEESVAEFIAKDKKILFITLEKKILLL